ncbi:MAG TPA: enoyl-CoA hydratase-related protein [Rugosimonospora sp.]|nr:enoyl-CoA hydratase-related protein [Rugosimonospora sp.]
MSNLETGTDHLLAAQESGVLSLTLNRPEVRNALSLPMLDALGEMLDRAARSPEVHVVVLAGAGGTFCAGGDVTLLARGGSIFGAAKDGAGRLARQQAAQWSTVVRLHELAKPTVAVLEGAAVGAGLGLALACDLRYAGTSATLRTGFGRLGLAGDFGCTWLLRELVGAAKALELLYFSDVTTAAHAEQLGLVNGTVPDRQVRSHALERARRLATVPPQALGAMKQHVRRAGSADLAYCADVEAEWHVRLVATEEHRAAVRALTNANTARRGRS